MLRPCVAEVMTLRTASGECLMIRRASARAADSSSSCGTTALMSPI
jgi:hypothetical protein